MTTATTPTPAPAAKDAKPKRTVRKLPIVIEQMLDTAPPSWRRCDGALGDEFDSTHKAKQELKASGVTSTTYRIVCVKEDKVRLRERQTQTRMEFV